MPFVELQSQFHALEGEIRGAMERVLQRGWYVLGEEGLAFEREFAEWLGVAHVAGVGSGTDAIHLALRAAGVGPGDEVITVANTCVPTVAAIAAAGARPALVDAHGETLTLDPAALEGAITEKTRAIVPVHLYGHPCDMDPILDVARRHALVVVEDCAQAHGALYKGRHCGTLGDLAAFSFYPSKNLGAMGDGGAVATNNPDWDQALRRLRNYGEATRYHHVTEGINSRLDELQAAILRAKLPHLRGWNEARKALAARYAEGLSGLPLQLPPAAPWAESNYHLYPVRTAHRDALQAHLRDRGIQTLMHYPVPIHLQPAYVGLGYRPGDFPVAEASCARTLSLPMYPELTAEAQAEVSGACVSFFTE